MIACTLERPLRIVVVDTAGKTHVIDAVSVRFDGELRKARSAAALKGEAPKPKGATTYQPAERNDDDIKSVLRGDHDHKDRIATRVGQVFVLEVLCAMRMRLFGQAACPYSVRDVQLVGSALGQGVRASDLAKAIFVAGQDPFWRAQGDIRCDALVKHVAGLSARYAQQREQARIVAGLRKLDPVAADALEGVIASRRPDDIAAALREAQARIKNAAARAAAERTGT